QQTIWWFLIGVFAVLMLFFDWMTLFVTDGNYTMSAAGILKEGTTVIPGTALTAYLIVEAIFNFAIIFLYKKRILQSRLTVISIILSLGTYGLVALYRYMSFTADVTSTNFNWPLILPAISAILGIMAFRHVLMDEAKVRSLDRLR
ncbi:MAG: DUF4293 domain-containing protein, partial [Bacteroidales bacterium]|nr:DUF4293 domain-containing protein [Bacteroidales bacterium]